MILIIPIILIILIILMILLILIILIMLIILIILIILVLASAAVSSRPSVSWQAGKRGNRYGNNAQNGCAEEERGGGAQGEREEER